MKKTISCLALVACLASAGTLMTFTSGCSGDRYHRSAGETIDDASLTAKVKSKLIGDPDVKALDVKVDTFRGQVQLSGFVDNATQKQRAEELARQVQGVQMVQNNLMIKTQEPAGAKRPAQNGNQNLEIDVNRK